MNITSKLKAAYEGDKEAIDELNKIKEGLYIIVMKPTFKVTEFGKKSNPIKQTIEAGKIMIKPGKFEGGMWNRFRASGSMYNNVWLNENKEKCFNEFTETYLVCDVSHSVGKYVRALESTMVSNIEHVFGTSIGQSDYFPVAKDQVDMIEKRISIIIDNVQGIIEEDSRPCSLRKMLHGL